MIAAPVARRRPTLRCTRCGSAPRLVLEDGTVLYLCGACLFDGKAEAEQARSADPDHPRLWLIQHMGWRGGWPRTP